MVHKNLYEVFITSAYIGDAHWATLDWPQLGMCGMDFASLVRFRFGFENNCGFSSVSVLKKRRFGFLCRSVVKYKKNV